MSALAERCVERATDLEQEAELLAIELSVHEGVKDARWEAYQSNPSALTVGQWRMFYDRMTLVKSNLKMTRADAEHYRECAAALSKANTSGASKLAGEVGAC